MKMKLKLKSLHFAVGALVIGAFLPLFIKNDYYMMVLNRVLINIIVVLGLNFITGLTAVMEKVYMRDCWNHGIYADSCPCGELGCC